MPTFIKTGFWEKLSKAPKNYLDLDLLIASAALPSQSGNGGKYLTTDGSIASWADISLTGYVPYTGATSAVNLGAYDLTVNGLTVGKGASNLANNTVVGVQAGQSFTTGSINTAVGKYALLLTTTGERNVAVGYSALDRNTSGSQNTAIGGFSMYEMQSGTRNIAMGYNAGRGITTGNYNTIIGAQTVSLPASLSNNIILADGQGNIKYRWDGTDNTITGDLNVTGVLKPTVTTNRQTASYILALSDRGKLVETNVATPNNLTVPLDSVVAFPIGTQLEVVQYGAGQTTIVAAVGVTIRSNGGNLKIAAQYVAVSLIKIGTNEWYCFGQLSA